MANDSPKAEDKPKPEPKKSEPVKRFRVVDPSKGYKIVGETDKVDPESGFQYTPLS